MKKIDPKALESWKPQTTGSPTGRRAKKEPNAFGNVSGDKCQLSLYRVEVVDGRPKQEFVTRRSIGAKLFREILSGGLRPLTDFNPAWCAVVPASFSDGPYAEAYAEAVAESETDEA